MRALGVLPGLVVFALFYWYSITYTTPENITAMTLLGIVVGLFSGFLIVASVRDR